MKKVISLISAVLAVTVIGLGVIYLFLTDKFFFPWNQSVGDKNVEIIFNTDNLEQDIFNPENINLVETDEPYTELGTPDTIQEEKETIIGTYYSQLGKPRFMALSPNGHLLVSDIKVGAVYALIDDDNDYVADRIITVIDKLNNPHGLAFNANDLYIAETDKVRVLRGLTANYSYIRNDVIINNLTDSAGHFSRTIAIRDGKLYLSAGSSCNACEETNDVRAAITRYNLDGSGKEVFANGLRNSVGLDFDQDGRLYATENGRDWLGDNLPPEEVNIIELGNHYGWPYCYGDRIRDESFEAVFDCSTTTPPLVAMDAHMAPLGLRFYYGEMFPEIFGDLLVAFHGSWNSSRPVGYKVSRIEFDDQRNPGAITDFMSDFISGTTIKARPVDILVGTSGEIYVSDDFGGKIFVMYRQ